MKNWKILQILSYNTLISFIFDVLLTFVAFESLLQNFGLGNEIVGKS
jgi:hypothetical protein